MKAYVKKNDQGVFLVMEEPAASELGLVPGMTVDVARGATGWVVQPSEPGAAAERQVVAGRKVLDEQADVFKQLAK